MTARCRVCDWTGTTDTAADKHTKATSHPTVTSWADFEPSGGLAWTPDEEIEESQARLRESHPEVWAAWLEWCDEELREATTCRICKRQLEGAGDD